MVEQYTDSEFNGHRKKLQLKPRSVHPSEQVVTPPTTSQLQQQRRSTSMTTSSTKKVNPFGAAKPREQVLLERGVDPSIMDSRIERKASIPHFTKEQEIAIEAVRAELTRIEEDWRTANEMELPEEDLRVAADSKRKELHELMEKFAKDNEKKHDDYHFYNSMTTSTSAPVGGAGTTVPTSRSAPMPLNTPFYPVRRSSGSRNHHYNANSHNMPPGDEDEVNDAFRSFSSNRRRRYSSHNNNSYYYKEGGGFEQDHLHSPTSANATEPPPHARERERSSSWRHHVA